MRQDVLQIRKTARVLWCTLENKLPQIKIILKWFFFCKIKDFFSHCRKILLNKIIIIIIIINIRINTRRTATTVVYILTGHLLGLLSVSLLSLLLPACPLFRPPSSFSFFFACFLLPSFTSFLSPSLTYLYVIKWDHIM